MRLLQRDGRLRRVGAERHKSLGAIIFVSRFVSPIKIWVVDGFEFFFEGIFS